MRMRLELIRYLNKNKVGISKGCTERRQLFKFSQSLGRLDYPLPQAILLRSNNFYVSKSTIYANFIDRKDTNNQQVAKRFEASLLPQP